MKLLRSGWFFGSMALLLMVGGCDSDISVRDNPFDPEGSTPAPATVRGGVNAPGRPALPARASNEDILVRIFLEEEAPATGTDGGEAPASERTARTDAEGIFLFPDVAPGIYRLEVAEPGFAAVTLRSVAVPLAANVDLGIIELVSTVETAPSAVTGLVLLEGRDPLAPEHGGISVRTVGWPFDVLTAPDGTFNLPISDGTFDFEISFPNYETLVLSGITVGVGETVALDGDTSTPQADPLILLSNPGAIIGTVERELCTATPPVSYEAGDGVLITGGVGTATTHNAVADPTGAFTLGGLAAGSYRVDLALDGWETVTIRNNQVSAGQLTDLGMIRLAASRGAIMGRMELSGAADHSGILVQVNGTNFVTLTAADGSFRIPGVCAGTGYEIVASRDGYVTTSISGLAVTAGQDTRVTDAAGNDPVLERQQGGLTLNGGFPYVNTLGVGYQLDAPAGTTHMRISEDPSVFSTQGDPSNPDPGTNGGWVAYSVTGTFTLTSSEGTHEVTAQVYGNGAFSGLIQGTVVLDQTAPLQPTIVVEDGSGFSNDLDGSVLTTLTASEAPAPGVDVTSGLASVKFVDLDPTLCGAPPCPPLQADWDAAIAQPYNRTIDHATLDPLADGAKEIWVTFSDRAGNWSAPVSAGFILDRQPPAGISVSINNGDAFARSDRVSVSLTATDDYPGIQMRLANDSAFLGAQWQPFSPQITWFLDAQTDGTKEVWVQFMDAAGNITQALFDDIVLDRALPIALAFDIVDTGGVPIQYSSSGNLRLRVSAADSTQMVFSKNPSFLDAAGNPEPWVGYVTNYYWPVSLPAPTPPPLAEGSHTIYAQFRDDADNRSATLSASVIVDQSNPTVAGARLADGVTDPVTGFTHVTATNVTLLTTAIPGPLDGHEMMIEVAMLDASGNETIRRTAMTWGTYSPSQVLTLDTTEGRQRVIVTLRDAAGNLSPPASVDVVLDGTSPTLTGVVLTSQAARIDGGSGLVTHTGIPQVSLAITVSDPADAAQMRIANRADFAGAIWQPFAAALDWTLPPVDQLHTVHVEVRDIAGNIGSGQVSVTLDRQAPTGVAVTLDGGSSYTRDLTVDLVLAATDASSGMASVQLSNDPGFTTSQTDPWPATGGVPDASHAIPGWTLEPVDGLATLYVRFTDAVGNVINAAGTIIVDREAPVGTLRIDGDRTYATGTAVVLSFTAPADTADALISNSPIADCDTATGYSGYSPSRAWTLATGDATKTVHACLRDAAGNTYAVQDEIVLDTTDPTGGSVAIDGGAAYATNTPVTLTLTADADVTHMAVGNGALDCGTATYEPFASVRSWVLTGGDATKTVTVCFRDAAGRTGSAADTIVLDTTVPAGSIVLDAGAAVTDTVSVSVDLTHSSDTAGYALANGALDCGVATYTGTTGTSTSTTWSLPAGDGVKTLVVCFEDGAGNTASYATTITLDQTAPVGTLAIDGGALYTDAVGVQLEIVAPGDTARMTFSNTAIADCDAATGWQAFAPSRAWTLAAGDGTRTVYGCLEDTAGNTAPLQDEIVLDTTLPAGTIALQGDTSGYTLAGSGTGYTFSPAVQALLSAPADTTQVALADGPTLDCNTATYRAFAGVIPHTLPAGDGSKDVSVCFKDAAGNTASTSASITLDTAPPTLGLTLDSGAAYTRDLGVAVGLSFLDDTSGYALAESSLDCANATYTAVTIGNTSASTSFTLSAGDGTKTVVACVREAAGRVISTSAAIILDTGLPSGTVTIDGGATYATGTTVSLRFAVPADTARMSIANAATLDCATATYVGFSSPFTWSLSAGDGLKTVTACLEDAAGNRDSASDTITLDTANPTGSMTIDAGATHTQTASVVLDFTASTDVTGLAVREAATLDCATAAYQPYTPSMAFTLSAALGSKNLVACFRDAAGRTGTTSAIIILDASSPTGTITLAAGVAYTTGTTVAVALAFPDDTTGYALGDGVIDCASATYTPVTVGDTAASTTHTLAAGDGTKTVSACFIDAATNTAWSADTIILDTTPPSGTITIDLGATYNTTGAASLAFSAPADTAELAVADGASINCGTATYQGFASPLAWPLPGPDGTKTVSVCFKDAAGLTASAQDTITLDTTDPAGTLSIQGDTSGYTLVASPAGYTFSASVSLALSAPPDTTSLAIANGATINCGTASYQPFASLVAHTLPGADGSKSVSVCFKDAAGRTSSTTDAITLDTAPPTGALSLDAGSAYSADLSVAVGLSFLADTNGYALAENALDCGSATYTAVTVGNTSASTSFTISSGDGVKTVVACIREAGGRAVTAQDTILLDRSAPVGSVSIDNGALYDTDSSVTLTFSAPSDTTQLAVADGATINCGSATYQAFVSSLTWPLPGADGTKTVSVCYRDGAGNTASASDTIILDTSSPTTGTLSIAAGAAYTTSTVVSLDLTAPADVAEVAIANAASLDCDTASYGPFTTPRTWVLTAGDGGKTVTACFRDAAGRTGSASDTITLDTSAPAGTITLAGGQAHATSTPFAVALTFPDDTDGYAIAEGSLDCAAATYTSVTPGATAASTTFPPSSGDGVKTVVACFRDVAGNRGSAVDTVTLDTSPPAGSVAIDAGAVYATSTGVTLNLSAPADTVLMAVREAASIVCSDGTLVWEAFATTKGLTLGGQGTRSVSVCFEDAAGLRASASDSILVDSVAPSGSVAINGGASHTRTQSVTLDITAAADVVAISVADGGTILCGSVTYEPFSAARAWSLPAGEGSKTVSVCLKDAAGNTASVSDAITLDTNPPSTATLTINAGAAYTTNASGQVTLTLTTPETVTVAIGNESLDCSSATYGPFVNPVNNHPLQNQDGLRTVVACFKDAAGWTVAKSDDIILDRVDPTVSLTIAGGAAFTTSDTVDLSLTAASDVDEMAVVNGAIDCGAASYVSYAPSVASFDLDPADLIPGNDGAKTVSVCVKDAAGRTSSTSATIILDRVSPTSALTIVSTAGLPGYTTRRDVSLQFGPRDGSVEISVVDGTSLVCATAAYQPYVASQTWTLPSGEGTKNVTACFRDAAGNTTSSTDSIELDTVPSTGTIALAGGADYSQTSTVSVDLTFSNDTIGYYLANGSLDCNLIPVASHTVVVPPATSPAGAVSIGLVPPDGSKTVTVCLLDRAGNRSAYSDSIVLDTLNPTGSVVINDNDVYTTNQSVNLALTAAADVTQMLVSNTSAPCTQAPFEAFASTKIWSLDPVNGTKKVYVCLKDVAGRTTVVADTIRFDDVDPDVSAATINLWGKAQGSNNQNLTMVRDLTVRISGAFDNMTGQAFLEVQIAEDPTFSGVAWQPYAAGGTVNLDYTLRAGDGLKTVYVRFRDQAGNVSASLSDTITLDETAPTSPGLIINGGAEFTNVTGVTLSLWAADATQYSTDGGATWTNCLAAACVAASPGEDHAFTLPVGDGNQWVGVILRDAAGNESNYATDNILLDQTPPDVPRIDAISPRTTSALVNVSGGADVRSGFDHYRIHVYQKGGPKIATADLASSSDWVTGLPAFSPYEFRASAFDQAGNESAESALIEAFVGLAPSVTTGMPSVPDWHDQVLSWRGQVLIPRISPSGSGIALGVCDGRNQPCSEAGFNLSVWDPGGADLRAISITSWASHVWIFAIRGTTPGAYTLEALYFDQDPDLIGDVANWDYVSLGATSTEPSGLSFDAAAGGKAIAVAYLDVNGATPVTNIHYCYLDTFCTNASDWSGPAAIATGTTTIDLPAGVNGIGWPYDYTSLELDIGENHMWISQTAYDSGAGTYSTVLRGCPITLNCGTTTPWRAVHLGTRSGAHYSTTVKEGDERLYVHSLAEGATTAEGMLWTCDIGSPMLTWNAYSCSSAANFTAGDVLYELNLAADVRFLTTSPWFRLEGQDAQLTWHAGILSTAAIDLGTRNLLGARCNTHASDCGVAANWNASTLLEGLLQRPQALVTHIDGNPLIIAGADEVRTYLMEPPTRAPMRRALLPDFQSGGMRASWLAQNTSSIQGYRIDYNGTVATDPFDSSVVVATLASEGTPVPPLNATAHHGVVSSFSGLDQGPAEPVFTAWPAQVFDLIPDIGDAFSKYANNSNCHGVVYVPVTGEVVVATCPLSSNCGQQSNWKTAVFENARDLGSAPGPDMIGDLAIAMDNTRVSVAYAYATEPQNLEYEWKTIDAACTISTDFQEVRLVNDTGTDAVPTPNVAPRSISMVTDGTGVYLSWDLTDAGAAPLTGQMNLSSCQQSTGCDALADFTTVRWDRSFEGGALAIMAGTYLYWTPEWENPTNLDTFLYRCTLTTGCDLAGEWSSLGTIFRNRTIAFPKAMRIDPVPTTSGLRYRIVVTRGNQLAWCNEQVSCGATDEWSRGIFLASPYYNLQTPLRMSATSLGTDLAAVTFGGESWGMGRCKSRCYEADEWLGGFTRPPVHFLTTNAGATVWDSVGSWTGINNNGRMIRPMPWFDTATNTQPLSILEGRISDYLNR
ncbi:MAG: hypothetical protein P1V51_15640 [Deltaproteobacteria bacterium]|nr:hypothetical protein [Deltaproteobacteria bacterium]